MIELSLIIDGLMTSAMIGFTVAEIKQFIKIKRTKQTAGISLTHYYFKSYSVVATTSAFGLSMLYGLLALPTSFVFGCIESILVIGATVMVRHYRKVKK